MVDFVKTFAHYHNKFNFGHFFSSLKFISKFNPGFTSHGYLNCVFIKTLYNFKVKRADAAKGNQFLIQNVQNKIFVILKIFKNISLINSKISNNEKQHHHFHILRFLLMMDIVMLKLLNVFSTAELHSLKSFSVNCSNTACSSNMRFIFFLNNFNMNNVSV